MKKANPIIASKLFNPKIAIWVFISLIVLVPFYESKRIILWETQREAQKNNIFNNLVLAYVSGSETIKKMVGLDDFFEKEHLFWIRLKKNITDIAILQDKEAVVIKNESENSINYSVLFSEIEKLVKSTDLYDSFQKEILFSTGRTENFPEAITETEKIKDSSSLVIATPSEPGPSPKEEQKDLIKTSPPFQILIIGDSFMAVGGGVGDPLESKLLDYREVVVKRLGRVSSGLSRPEYFNWNLTANVLIQEFNPDIVIAMLGSNDAQTLFTDDNKEVKYGSPDWDAEYIKRVSNFLEIFQENNIAVFWIGLPIMREKNFSGRIEHLNSIYKEEISTHENDYFVSIWELLADSQGDYVAYLPNANGRQRLARASDGIHLQYFAGGLVSSEVIKKMSDVLELEPKD